MIIFEFSKKVLCRYMNSLRPNSKLYSGLYNFGQSNFRNCKSLHSRWVCTWSRDWENCQFPDEIIKCLECSIFSTKRTTIWCRLLDCSCEWSEPMDPSWSWKKGSRHSYCHSRWKLLQPMGEDLFYLVQFGRKDLSTVQHQWTTKGEKPNVIGRFYSKAC